VSAEGLDVSRAAEIIVDMPGGAGRRGSGYRIATTSVLTALHVVTGAARIRVRFDADTPHEWSALATIRLSHRSSDLAVLAISGEDAVSPVRYGRIPERDAVVACSGLGFPRFKWRDDGSTTYRDILHLLGHAPVLSNRRSGTLEIDVATPPERDAGAERSPWEGMSGAPVFAAGRLIAVVTGNHALEGVGRLEATRLDSLFHSGPATLRDAIGLPAALDELTDVMPAPARSLELAVHQAEIASIAPDRLFDRQAELEEFTEFCSRPEHYLWWQAGPWAGKTALAATFAADPPDGVRVASFFVTARLAGQADAATFSAEIVRQLAEIAEIPLPASPGTNLLPYLTGEAARRCASRGERLLMIVDGLDEDQGVKPSIASLLPRHPPENLRVLVMSRPHPGIPGDVDPDHPLRTSRIRVLGRSEYARHLEIRAREELKDLIIRGGDEYDIIALITASGGGLTTADLAELTGRQHHQITWHIESVFGRSLTSRTRSTDTAYLFAHETLRDTAEHILALELAAYYDRLHTWAERYRARGWPHRTPGYLYAPYTRRLAHVGSLARLVPLAADWRRHDRMLELTRTDQAALAEISSAWKLLAGENSLTPLTLLAAERERLIERQEKVPLSLAAVWARLGYLSHAALLSRGIVDEDLVAYGSALVEAGRYEEAEEVARRFEGAEALGVWAALLEAFVGTAEFDRVFNATLDHLDRLAAMGYIPYDSRPLEEMRKVVRRTDSGRLERVTARIEAMIPENDLDTDDPELLPTAALYPARKASKLLRAAIDRFDRGDPVMQQRMIYPLTVALTRSVPTLAATERVINSAYFWVLSPQDPLALQHKIDLTMVVAEHDAERGARLLAKLFPDLLPETAQHAASDAVAATVGLCSVLLRDARSNNTDDVRDILERAERAARTTFPYERPHLLAQIAGAILPVDRVRAEQLATEAESTAGKLPLARIDRTRERLIQALLRLGRPHDAEQLLKHDGPLTAEIAQEYARSSPADADRLVDRALSKGRWPSAWEGHRGKKIDEADLARLSSAIAQTRPSLADQLADRAIARAQGHTNPKRKFEGLLAAAANLSPHQTDKTAAAMELALDMIGDDETHSTWRSQAARTLAQFDPDAANDLIDIAGAWSEEAEIHRIAALTLIDADQAVERAETILDQPEESSWLLADLAQALIGTRDAPGHPSLLPIARRTARLLLAGDHWSDMLPILAVLEPAALEAILEWFQELTSKPQTP